MGPRPGVVGGKSRYEGNRILNEDNIPHSKSENMMIYYEYHSHTKVDVLTKKTIVKSSTAAIRTANRNNHPVYPESRSRSRLRGGYVDVVV